MKQRFEISRNAGGEDIIIKEYAELDKGVYSLLCEETYAVAALEAALAQGPDHLVARLRTESFFPTRYYAEKLIASLADYFQQASSETVAIEADDAECIAGRAPVVRDEESSDMDDLLEVGDEEIVAEEVPVGKLDAPIRIAEDETAEISNSL